MLTKSEVENALKKVDGFYSPAMTDLLFRTACHESLCGTHVIQIGGGPARGVYQMEPETHDDVWETYIEVFPALEKRIHAAGFRRSVSRLLEIDYATIIGACKYRRFVNKKRPLPVGLPEQAAFWKKFWNTNLGKGTIEKFINDVRRYEK